MIRAIFNPEYWASVPFHFWSFVMFGFGCIVGSFLNVVIYRLPLGLSVVHPPSHCPHCKYSIPWYLNIPLLTWLSLKGKCRNCGAPISIRYFLVELLTGVLFLLVWLVHGRSTPGVAIVYAIFAAILIAATFIDFEHFIIPDELTIGGAVAGFIFSMLFPSMHRGKFAVSGMAGSLLGIFAGAGIVYFIVRLGKWIFGRKKFQLEPSSRVVFGETSAHLPDGSEIFYGDVFFRPKDTIRLQAEKVELIDRCYSNVAVRLLEKELWIGEECLNPETVPHMEVVTGEIVIPREAMGLGDVKFMAAIGAFLGWQAVLFSLMVSSMIGALVGVTLIATGRREWSSRLPYGPYIAMAALLWIFGGDRFVNWWFGAR